MPFTYEDFKLFLRDLEKEDDVTPKSMQKLLKRVTTENLWIYVLALLLEKPRYGYEIRKLISERFGFEPATVSGYVILYKAMEDGLIDKVTYVPPEKAEKKNAPVDRKNKKERQDRIYYAITDKGREAFNAAKKFFQIMLDVVFKNATEG